MRATTVRIVAAIARAWVRLHTCGLDDALRTRRIAEIESDLWEFQHDRTDGSVGAPLDLLYRVIAGVPDDLAWRWERVTLGGRWSLRVASLAIVAAMLLWTPAPPPLAVLAVSPNTTMVSLAGPVVAHSPWRAPSTARGVVVREARRPDFSGVWTLDGTRSTSTALAEWDPRRIAGVEDTILLWHTPTALLVERTSAIAPAERVRFDLSGLVESSRRGGERVIRRASWSGTKLITVTTRVTRGSAWSTIDVRWLSPDGLEMIVERINEAGERWGTYQGREPDPARHRTRDVFIRVQDTVVLPPAGTL